MAMSLTPISSMTSSPLRSPSLPIIESQGYDDREDYDNDDTPQAARDYIIEQPDDDDVADTIEDTSIPDVTYIPFASLTSVRVVHLPQKGITAWLAHMQRKQRRSNIFDKLRSLLF
jgi:hypothetical protein